MSAPVVPATAKVYRLPHSKEEYTDATALRAIDEPVTLPGKGQVLVKMRAASLNFRDLLVATKAYPTDYPLDLIPLSDGAGDVVAVGEGVTKFIAGDRVINTFFQTWIKGPAKGAYFATARGGATQGILAQYNLFDATELVRIPHYLSYEEASTIPCTGVTAYNALFTQSPITSSSSVLVLGTGGLSIYATQLAKAVGARVIATSSSDVKLDIVKRNFGVDSGINYVKTPDWSAEVLKLTGGEGVDHVLEIGGAGTLLQSLKAAGNGHVHLLGTALSASGEAPAIDVLSATAIFGATHIHGIYVGSREMAEKLVNFMEEYDIHPVIDKVFDWDHVADAFAHQTKGSGMGKVVISIQ